MIIDVALRLCVRARCSTTSRVVTGEVWKHWVARRKKRSQVIRRVVVRGTRYVLGATVFWLHQKRQMGVMEVVCGTRVALI